MVAFGLRQEHNEVFRGVSAAYALYRYSNFILPVCLFLHTRVPIFTQKGKSCVTTFYALAVC